MIAQAPPKTETPLVDKQGVVSYVWARWFQYVSTLLGTATAASSVAGVNLPVFANNAAAVAGGLRVGQFYRTGADPDFIAVAH